MFTSSAATYLQIHNFWKNVLHRASALQNNENALNDLPLTELPFEIKVKLNSNLNNESSHL